MSMKNRQLEILGFLGPNERATRMEIHKGLNWPNWHLTKTLILDLVVMGLLEEEAKPKDPGLAKFFLTEDGRTILSEFGG